MPLPSVIPAEGTYRQEPLQINAASRRLHRNLEPPVVVERDALAVRDVGGRN